MAMLRDKVATKVLLASGLSKYEDIEDEDADEDDQDGDGELDD